MKKKVSIFLIAAGSIALVLGISAIFNYKKKLNSHRPVNAYIVSTKVEEHTSTSWKSGATYTNYKPVVHFNYWVNDREMKCSSVFPEYINWEFWQSGYDWACEIIGKFEEGMEVDAFYDPTLPDNAFLIKQYWFVYYGFFVCLPMFFILLGILLLTQSKNRLKKPIEPVKLDSQQFEISPYMKPSEYMRATLIMFITSVPLGVWIFWHYFSHAQPPYEDMAYYFAFIYAVISLLITGYLIYFFMLGRSMGDARIYTDTHVFFIGKMVNAVVRQEYKKRMSIEKVTLVLKAEAFYTRGKGKMSHSYSHHTKQKTVLKGRDIEKGETLEIPVTSKIPPNKQPTTFPDENINPTYQWRLELKIRIRNRPNYRAKYPIIVEKK